MNFKILISFFLFLSLITTSCHKMLNLKPNSSLTENNFWFTPDDASAAVTGMYTRMRDVTNANLFLWGEARAQDFIQAIGNHFATLRIFQNTIDPTESGPDWSILYRVIGDANLIIKNVPDIEFTDELEKNKDLAQAYAMRAFCYFILVRTWGAVPIVLEPTEGIEQEKLFIERSSVSDVFSLIKDDLDTSNNLFGNDYNFPEGRNRWSKPAVLALRGDVYLWTGRLLDGGDADFEIALASLDSLRAYSDVELLKNFKDVFDYDNKGNKEVIMANTFKLLESSGSGIILDNTASGGTGGGLFYQNMFLDQFPTNSDPHTKEMIGPAAGGAYYRLRDEIKSDFNEDDLRKDATFISLFYGSDPEGPYDIFYSDIEQKFPGIIDGGARRFLDDIIIYRYADILLLIAEAKNALGIDPSDEINEVRERAYGANFPDNQFINEGKEDNFDSILKERELELLYEGKRWWDILRFQRAFDLVPYFKNHPNDDFKLLWPISLDILSLEPNVKQNPGY